MDREHRQTESTESTDKQTDRQTDRQTDGESIMTLSSVVIARVAMLRLESVIRFSRSTLHAVTAAGCFIATYTQYTSSHR